jgi:hypothetical protein
MTLTFMNAFDLPVPHQPPDPLDELVLELLSIGGALSQIIARMLESTRSGRSSPDAAPIPDIAFGLIRSVLGPVARKHSKRDIRASAKIVRKVTDQICNEIYLISPEYFDELDAATGGDCS